MSRFSRFLAVLITSFVFVGLMTPVFDANAQDKKKKKKDDKDKTEVKDKKDDKDKKEEKKPDPFKADPAQSEFKYVEKDKVSEKEKTYWVYDVAFSADGKSVAATYGDKAVRIWALGKKDPAQTLKGPAKDAKGLAHYQSLVLLDGQVYVGTGWWNDKKKAREGDIRAFDAKTGQLGKSLAGHTDNVLGLAKSKDGKLLVSTSEDQTAKIWDLSKGEATQTIKGHTGDVTSAAFSSDGTKLVTTSKDKTLRVWDIAGAKEIASFKVEREVEVKDAKGKVSKQKELGREFTHAVFTNDGKNVIAGNLDGVVKIYEIEGKKEVRELKAAEGLWSLALSPDGTKVAAGGWDGTIKIWNVADGKELKSIKAHLHQSEQGKPGNVSSLSFSPDGLLLASGGLDGTVKVWSVK